MDAAGTPVQILEDAAGTAEFTYAPAFVEASGILAYGPIFADPAGISVLV